MLAKIDSSISFDRTSVRGSLLEAITAELRMKNPDKARALAEKIRGASQLPDTYALFSIEGKRIVIPRGFAHRLEGLASEYGEEVIWENKMTLLPHSANPFRSWKPVELRGYQAPARDAMLDWAQGIFQAPTGSGKTCVALETVRWAGQKTLIIVGKTSLARQWEAELREKYGYEAGYIGEQEWREADVTIATWQTLWSRWTARSAPEGFWESFGCVIGDEIHHASAHSLTQLFNLFPAFYRLGVSATPKWDQALYPIVQALIGPIIHTTTEEEVSEVLIHPSVRFIESSFEAEYIPTHIDGHKRVQNNYSEIVGELVIDPDRNDLIAGTAREEAQDGHHVLIVTRRTEHVRQLVERLEKTLQLGSQLHVLTGSQTGHDAQRIARAIESSDRGTVLISTVADEALDMPRLDRLILAFPLRRLPLIEQQIGRIRRPAPGKEDAVVFDVIDPATGPLDAQRRQRAQFYMKRRWPVLQGIAC